jgi:hypothetical protein
VNDFRDAGSPADNTGWPAVCQIAGFSLQNKGYPVARMAFESSSKVEFK